MENGMVVKDVAGKQLQRYEQRGRPVRVDSPGPLPRGEKRSEGAGSLCDLLENA